MSIEIEIPADVAAARFRRKRASRPWSVNGQADAGWSDMDGMRRLGCWGRTATFGVATMPNAETLKEEIGPESWRRHSLRRPSYTVTGKPRNTVRTYTRADKIWHPSREPATLAADRIGQPDRNTQP